MPTYYLVTEVPLGGPARWEEGGGGGAQNLAQTLVIGNFTGGTDILMDVGDEIVGEFDDGVAGPVVLRGGTATGGVAAGGDVVLAPGTGVGGSADGIAVTEATHLVTESIRGGEETVVRNYREDVFASGQIATIGDAQRVHATWFGVSVAEDVHGFGNPSSTPASRRRTQASCCSGVNVSILTARCH